MSPQTMDVLNKILQGEQIAIDLYKFFLTKINNQYLVKHLQSIHGNHLRHRQIIIARIEELGGQPKPNKGSPLSQMLEFINKAKTTVYPDYIDILKDLTNGELMGIDRTQQIIYDRLGKEDLQMVQDILSQEMEHIRKLKYLVRELAEQRVH